MAHPDAKSSTYSWMRDDCAGEPAALDPDRRWARSKRLVDSCTLEIGSAASKRCSGSPRLPSQQLKPRIKLSQITPLVDANAHWQPNSEVSGAVRAKVVSIHRPCNAALSRSAKGKLTKFAAPHSVSRCASDRHVGFPSGPGFFCCPQVWFERRPIAQ